jgi:hypothetical protein
LKIKPLLLTSLFLSLPLAVHAGPVLIIGTPGDSLLATPTGPSPNLDSILLTFSELTPFSTFDPSTYASEGVTISSPDGLTVLPFSTQSNPNYLYDNGVNGDGTADITIGLTGGTTAIGFGIADSDSPVNIEVQALGAGDVDLGSAFSVSIPEDTINPGNGYFVVEDSTPDIFGLVITQTDSSPLNSGLAIADVQVAPEPSSFLLLLGGATLVGVSRLRKRS